MVKPRYYLPVDLETMELYQSRQLAESEVPPSSCFDQDDSWFKEAAEAALEALKNYPVGVFPEYDQARRGV